MSEKTSGKSRWVMAVVAGVLLMAASVQLVAEYRGAVGRVLQQVCALIEPKNASYWVNGWKL